MSSDAVGAGLDGDGDAGVGFDEAFLGPLAGLPGVGDRPVVSLGYTHFTVVLDLARRLAVTAAVNVNGAALVDLDRGDDWHYDARVLEDGQGGRGGVRPQRSGPRASGPAP